MADATLFANLLSAGIIVTNRTDDVLKTYHIYYCLGGPNYRRQGTWVTTGQADNDTTKYNTIVAALA